jgi:hypothetical protein
LAEKLILDVNSLFPVNGAGADKVGVALLMIGAGATWSVFRPSPLNGHVSGRLVGFAALLVIVAGIFVGARLQGGLGFLLLILGFTLTASAMCLSLGIGWTSHIRPNLTPIVISVLAGVMFAFAPRLGILLGVALVVWGHRRITHVSKSVELHLTSLVVRVSALAHRGSAIFLAEEWFDRYSRSASNSILLCLARQSWARAISMPNSRFSVNAVEAFCRVSTLARSELDHRLNTNEAWSRRASTVRILAREFIQWALRRSGISYLVNFVSELLLAVPPASRHDGMLPVPTNAGFVLPDASVYVANIVGALPPVPDRSDLDALTQELRKELRRSGRQWLANVAEYAERWREGILQSNRDYRVEIAAEALWSVYESAMGPRPLRYDLFDQVRLQLPDFFEGLSVASVELATDNRLLTLTLDGKPKCFHELMGASASAGSPRRTIIKTWDHQEWRLERVEINAARKVQIVFFNLAYAEAARSPNAKSL